MRIRILSIISILSFSISAFPQFLLNKGQVNIHSGYLVITGTYQNETSGNIILDGTMQVSGNWTNNAANTGMNATDGTGTVVFNGSSLQTIGGSSTSFFNFEGITINAGASVQVQAGTGVTAAGPCNFNTALVLKSSVTAYRPKMATFINNSTVAGNISMEFSYTSNGSAAAGGHGQFFSSPISNATTTIFGTPTSSNRLYYWDETVPKYSSQIMTLGTPLALMRGYLYRATATNVFAMTGPPNANASYSITGFSRLSSATKGWFLTGNPYPSVINWQTIGTRTNLDNSFWVRCATISGSMVVDTWNGALKSGTGLNGTTIDSLISPMQGFWVRVTNVGQTGTLGVANTDRGHNWGNAPYLKSSTNAENDILRLYISSGDAKDETIIAQADSASDEYDSWDSQKLPLSDITIPEIYTLAPDGSTLVIQSIKPVSEEKLFPLGMIIGTADTFKFKADLSQTTGQYSYSLEDKQLSVMQDLNQNPIYSFTSPVIKDSLGTRFVVHIAPLSKSMKSVTEVNQNSFMNHDPQIYSYGKDVFIRNCEINARIIIYNILGNQVYNSRSSSDKETISVPSASGIYLVKLENANSWKTQKVLLK
jgi:hypothetical protein